MCSVDYLGGTKEVIQPLAKPSTESLVELVRKYVINFLMMI